MIIDTDEFSSRMRAASVDVDGRRLLVTRFTGSSQEADLSEPTNAAGHGRVRHFKRETSDGWPPNSLPIDPACSALGRPPASSITAQVFQNAACNWRCWYCYVPFALLNADERRSSWVSPAQLVDWYLESPVPSGVIDLSGGQPDLVPEWTAWMAEELTGRGLGHDVYLWVDDNLSNDYYWRYLSEADRAAVAAYPAHGRVGCFKGFDPASFAFNTKADPALFLRQFELMGRHIAEGTDCYGYATFTSPPVADMAASMSTFVDALQHVDEMLPLRVVPLEIRVWGPVGPRTHDRQNVSLDVQKTAVEAWQDELESRFTSQQRAVPITEVRLSPR